MTIQQMMIVVGVVAILLTLMRSGVDLTGEVKRQTASFLARFYYGTTNAVVGVPPDR